MKSFLTLLLFTISLLIYGQTELLENENFTSEDYAWGAISDFHYNTDYFIYNFDIGYAYTTGAPHGLGTLYQDFDIPSDAESVEFSLWYRITTEETDHIIPFDICEVKIIELGDADHNHTFKVYSDNDFNEFYQYDSWIVPESFHGKSVRLLFQSDNDGLKETKFRFDNLSMSATLEDGGDEDAVDIIVFDQSISEEAVDPGTEIEVSCNQGWTGSLFSDIDPHVAYYLSSDPVWSIDDVYLGEDHSGLSPEDTDDGESASVLISDETSAGYYYVLFIADYLDEIDETNEGNNVVSVPLTVNGIAGGIPTVMVTSPNDYVCYSTASTIEIEAEITGAITGKEIQYSIDGGESWEFIWGIGTTDTELSYTWSVPSFDKPEHLKIKVIVSYDGGSVQDQSDVPCLVTTDPQDFELNPEGISHIFWPFENDWESQLFWVVSLGHDEGETHICLDHYSLDYVKSSEPETIWEFIVGGIVGYIDPICNPVLHFPFAGKVIKINDTLYDDCDNEATDSLGLGNYVAIQSIDNPNFIFRIGHLNYVNEELIEGNSYPRGTEFGNLGSTGRSNGPHAHCSLYKNVYEEITVLDSAGFPVTLNLYELIEGGWSFGLDTPFCEEIADLYSAEFEFNADFALGGGDGAGTISVSENDSATIDIYPNPTKSMIRITPSLANLPYSLTITDLAGRLVFKANEQVGNLDLDCTGFPSGVYLLHCSIDNIAITEKLIIE